MQKALEIVAAFWETLAAMSPYLLFGFLVAGFLSVVIPPEAVERHLGGRRLGGILKAAAFGVPLPLCSCSVIPVAASLRKHGASRGATTAFLLSTPQTGVDSILVTFSLLGPVFAIFRPIAALLSGILGGVLVMAFVPEDGNPRIEPCSEAKRILQGELPRCEDASCADGPRGGKLLGAFRFAFVTMPADIGKALFIGLIMAAFITALVPKAVFEQHLGRGIVPMLVMMAVGIPMYVCATASVPIAAALIAKGVSPGAAWVFLVTGPATNAATIATLWKTLGRRTAIIYLVTVAAGALAGGLLLDHIYTAGGLPHVHEAHEMLPAWLKYASAAVLLVVLVVPLMSKRLRLKEAAVAKTGERKAVLSISGMTCEHCVQTIRRALLGCAAVSAVHVNLKAGKATVAGGEFDLGELQRAVGKAGYEVTDAAVSA